MGTRPNVLWMGDLEPYMDVAFVKNAYEQLGHPVIDIRLIANKHNGVPAAYCFVEFKDADSAQKAMFQLNGKIIPGTNDLVRFKLNHASYGREHLNVSEFSIFVGGLTEDVDDFQLYSCFTKKYGTNSMYSAKVVLDQQGKSRGYGFVRFRNDEDRKKALVEMQRYQGLGQGLLHVSVAAAKSRAPATTYTQSGSNTTQTSTTPYSTQYTQYQYDPYNTWNQYYNTAAAGTYSGYGYSADPNATASQTAYYGAGWDQSGWGQQTTPTTATGTTTTTTAATSQQVAAVPPQTVEVKNDDDELEDPGLNIDVDALNKEFMERSEELYVAMEGSRWHPLDNVFSTIIPAIATSQPQQAH